MRIYDKCNIKHYIETYTKKNKLIAEKFVESISKSLTYVKQIRKGKYEKLTYNIVMKWLKE
jgi:hypothetical protein